MDPSSSKFFPFSSKFPQGTERMAATSRGWLLAAALVIGLLAGSLWLQPVEIIIAVSPDARDFWPPHPPPPVHSSAAPSPRSRLLQPPSRVDSKLVPIQAKARRQQSRYAYGVEAPLELPSPPPPAPAEPPAPSGTCTDRRYDRYLHLSSWTALEKAVELNITQKRVLPRGCAILARHVANTAHTPAQSAQVHVLLSP